MKPTSKKKFPNRITVCLIVITLFSCKKSTDPVAALSSEKKITAFSLKKADGANFLPTELVVTIEGDSIKATLPDGTSKTDLIPVITHNGASISPQPGIPTDFTSPVRYTVTARDGSTFDYTIQVAILPPTVQPTVFFGTSDKSLYALNAETGVLRWKFTGLSGGFQYASPTYLNGVLYAGCTDNYLYAFNALTGAMLWRFDAGPTGVESPPTVVNGTVFFGSSDDKLYAIDAVTGVFKWSYTTGQNVSTSPVVADGKVYFGSSDGKLYALTESTGQLIWSYQAGAMFNQSGPALANGVLYAGSRDGKLYAINASTGTLNWSFNASPYSLESSCATVANGIVYIGAWYELGINTNKGSLYAVNATTGMLTWEALPQTGFSSSPVVDNGRLFITGDDMKVHAIDAATGLLLWNHTILPNGSDPTVAGNRLYVGGGGDHYFYCYDVQSGTEYWKYNLPTSIMSSGPLVVNSAGIFHSGGSGVHN